MCLLLLFFCCFKQKTAYEMRISDWSSDVCSSDLPRFRSRPRGRTVRLVRRTGRFRHPDRAGDFRAAGGAIGRAGTPRGDRSDRRFAFGAHALRLSRSCLARRHERINICLARHPRRGATVEDGMAHYFEIKKNKAGEFVAYFKYNSEPIFWTEGYSSKASAQNEIGRAHV